MSASKEKQFLNRPMGQVVAGVWTRNTDSAASAADLKSLASADQVSGAEWTVGPNGLRYIWSTTSVLADDGLFVLVPTDAPAAGRWLLRTGQVIDIAIPFTFAQADASVVFTMPASGAKLQLSNAYYIIGTSFSGGSSSAIGLKGGAATGMTTAGDILGGAGGDLAATLVSTNAFPQGTVGAKMGKPAAVLQAADTVVYNKIASAFTAGVGTIHLVGAVIANAGA